MAPTCSEGGTSIEDLAEKSPEKIIKIPVDIRTGITDEQALQMAKGLAVTGDVNEAAGQIKALYKLFTDCDCTMVEVSEPGLQEWMRSHCQTRCQVQMHLAFMLVNEACMPSIGGHHATSSMHI